MSEVDSNLVTPKYIDSSKTLLKAADIRNYKPVLEVAKPVEEGAIPTSVMDHKKCRILFTMKLSRAKRDEKNTENPMEIQKRITWQAPSNNWTYDQICIFSTKRDPLERVLSLRETVELLMFYLAK